MNMMRKRTDALHSAHAFLGALQSSVRLLVVGMVALVLLYLLSGVTVINPNEVGLIMRFGQLLPQTHPPGLLMALPPPVVMATYCLPSAMKVTGVELGTAFSRVRHKSLPVAASRARI